MQNKEETYEEKMQDSRKVFLASAAFQCFLKCL